MIKGLYNRGEYCTFVVNKNFLISCANGWGTIGPFDTFLKAAKNSITSFEILDTGEPVGLKMRASGDYTSFINPSDFGRLYLYTNR